MSHDHITHPPAPEALLADFARRIHLSEDDTDYLLSLLQAARAAGSVAGAEVEREIGRRVEEQLRKRLQALVEASCPACAEAERKAIRQIKRGW